MAGDNATITALPNSEFTTPVTVRQPDSTVAACALTDVITAVAIINFINERIDFSWNEDVRSQFEKLCVTRRLPPVGQSLIEPPTKLHLWYTPLAFVWSSMNAHCYWPRANHKGRAVSSRMLLAITVFHGGQSNWRPMSEYLTPNEKKTAN
jgi:hypothetical protein